MSAHPRRRRGRGEWITGLAVGIGNWFVEAAAVIAWLVVIPYLILVVAP